MKRYGVLLVVGFIVSGIFFTINREGAAAPIAIVASPTSPLLTPPAPSTRMPAAWAVVAPFLSGRLTPPPAAQHVAPARRTGGSCGFVRVGNDEIPVDCHSQSYGAVLGSANIVASPSLGITETPDAPLPVQVDHRQEDTEGPVRNQGSVGACTAFSLAAAIDHDLLRVNVRTQSISAAHVWSRYHDQLLGPAIIGNLNHPLTAESSWPFTPDAARQACSWDLCSDPEPCVKSLGVQCNAPVDLAAVAAADAKPFATMTHVMTLFGGPVGTATDVHIRNFATALAKGDDIWFAMMVSPTAFENLLKGHDGLPFVVKDFQPSDNTAGHAMLLAGYATRPTGHYFLIHNSWSPTWGDGGYAWIHEATLRNNIEAAYVVGATAGVVPPLPPGVFRAYGPACLYGQAADSGVSGLCAPLCPDGSPRYKNSCPVASHCNSGFVNLSGQCVPAARTESGVDPSTGTTHQCGPGGCAYTIQHGRPGCAFATCSASCPAPHYKMALGSSSYVCL